MYYNTTAWAMDNIDNFASLNLSSSGNHNTKPFKYLNKNFKFQFLQKHDALLHDALLLEDYFSLLANVKLG